MSIVIAANPLPRHVVLMNTTDITEHAKNQHESTYALLVRSEEKTRNFIEMATYPLLVIGVIIAICQFALQPINPGYLLLVMP